jgi:hypothetical protein
MSISRRVTSAELSTCTKLFVGLVTTKKLEEQRACAWNFAGNLVKALQRHFNCLTKHKGRTVSVEQSAMSGVGQRRSQAWTTFHINKWRPCRESSWKSSFSCLRISRRSRNQHRILPSTFTEKLQMRRASAKFVLRLLTDGPQLSGKTSDIRYAPTTGFTPSRLFPISQT